MSSVEYTDTYAYPTPSNAINDLIKRYGLDDYMVLATSALLVLLLVWHVVHAFVKRLWLLPSQSSRVLALNAATLALLGIVAKPPRPGKESTSDGSGTGAISEVISVQFVMLADTVLMCTTIGALMPSVAASKDLKDMWSNVLAVGLLVLSTNFTIFLQLYYIPDDGPFSSITIGPETAMQHKFVMASLFLVLLVLLLQAVALEAIVSEIRTIVLQRLDQMSLEAKPGHKAGVIEVERRATWSWEEVEHNTRIKLMMVLTSSPQNVMVRSPCSAIVGAVVLLCVIFWCKVQPENPLFQKQFHFLSFLSFSFPGSAIVVCGFICVWRWLRVALHEDRSFLSLVLAAEPSYWCQKVNNLQQKLKAGPRRTQPNVFEEGQWGFQEVLWYTAAFLILCFVLPFFRSLVAFTRLTHILSAMLVQKLICLPIQAFIKFALCRKNFQKSSRVVDAVVESAISRDYDLGVVCLEGEDARIVGREFAGAANRIIRCQSKVAKSKSDLKALVSQLQTFECSTFAVGKSGIILDALHEDGAPYMENLHVEHGYQFGWSLTAISLVVLLAEMEVTVLGNSIMSKAAMNAYWQAMEMMQLVDEQFVPCIVCSKETYASACAAAWSKVQKNKHRWTDRRNRAKKEVQLDAINQLLKNILGPAKRHIEEFNDAKKSTYAAAAWSQQAVMSYTMHTLCENLLKCWTDIEAVAVANSGGGEESNARKIVEGMVNHMHALIVEVIACCLSNLPTAVDLSITDAVRQCKMSEIEKGLVVVAQGKHIWEELQWPTLYSTRNNGLGQLRQWMY